MQKRNVSKNVVDKLSDICSDGDSGIKKVSSGKPFRRSLDDGRNSRRIVENISVPLFKFENSTLHQGISPRNTNDPPTIQRIHKSDNDCTRENISKKGCQERDLDFNCEPPLKDNIPCSHGHTVIPFEAALPPQVMRTDIPPDHSSMPQGFHNHMVSMTAFLMKNAPANSTRQQLAKLLSEHLDDLLKKRNKAIEEIVEGMIDYNPNMVFICRMLTSFIYK